MGQKIINSKRRMNIFELLKNDRLPVNISSAKVSGNILHEAVQLRPVVTSHCKVRPLMCSVSRYLISYQ